MTRTILAAALICTIAAPAWSAEKATKRSFLRCGGWACSLTAVEWHGIDTAEAWALGRTTRRDAEKDCSVREGREFRACVIDQMRQPPVVITADCERGAASLYGGEEFKLSDKAKRGELPHAEDPAFWDGETTHRGRFTVITWFQLLCPKASARWNLRPEP